ncbi:MAG: 1-acyl-sn-glycerol-3-phosphate acyltransferase [Bacteroidia bacterium]|nr:1-acyl-sn-glycerol-3-phosphate acyltransferase [Bacteroidia bacterium]NNK70365.1 1-acyl-sn-glycerol-3-phosphate acyltransferase [Flavobacteriaceae bacterium]NNL79519.1 1-acyl-sn-glycerol-3-phosphate acyltransferase [Flavobacteriaceae bacterium]
MRYLKYPFWLFYRIWFYILVALPIIVLLPILLISISREKWYPFFMRLARFWSRFILHGMGFRLKIEKQQELVKGKSYMLIANHTSMIDIMLMLVTVTNHPFVFVGKKELAKIPLFGFFYRKTCILVDRSDAKSRQAVFKSAQRRLNSGLSICIFPEGLVPEENIILDKFKDGAFRLAINHQIPLVPVTFHDNKKRFSYIFFSGGPGLLRVTIHPFIETEGLTTESTARVRDEARNIILKTLENDQKKKAVQGK